MKNCYLFLCCILLLISCKKGDTDPQGYKPGFGTLSEGILKNYFIISIAFDKAGNAWLGTLNQGLVKYDGKATVVYDSSNSLLTKAAIWDIEIDRFGDIWFGSDNLIRFNGSKFTRYDPANFNLPKNSVRSVAIDASDNIWFSCGSFRSGGLVKYDRNKFTTYTPENSKLPGNLIQSIAIDTADNIWLAINDGIGDLSLTRISGREMEIFGSKQIGFSPYYFGNIVTDKRNELIASLNYGLSSTIAAGRPQIFKFNGSKSEILKLPNESSVIYSTQTIFVDKNDQLWASFSGDTDCGILKNGEWVFKNLGTDGIFVFAENQKGEIWLGTGNGVYILK